MFQVNDSVVYETAGVCIIKDICTQSFIKNQKKKYYVLDPVYKDANQVTIMIPVDTKKKMRKVMTKDEVHELIAAMPDMDSKWEENHSQRTEQLRQTMKDCDLHQLTSLFQSYDQRKKTLNANGKKLPKSDQDQMDVLEKRLLEEIAFILGIQTNEVRTYIASYHKKQTA